MRTPPEGGGAPDIDKLAAAPELMGKDSTPTMRTISNRS